MSERREMTPEEESVTKTEKSLEQMTDAEFVYNLDRMSRPDLITRLSDVCYDPVSIENFLRRSDLRVVDSRIPFTIETPKIQEKEPQTKVKTTEVKTKEVKTKETEKTPDKEKKGAKLCEKKRTALLILVALFSLVALVAIVLGVVGIKYAFPVQTEGKSYGIADPVVAAIDTLFKTEGGAYFDSAFASAVEWKEHFVAYATAIVTILYGVFFIAMFIKALYAAFERGQNGSYKKRDFVFPSVAALLCAVATVFGTSALTGVPFLSFVTMQSVPTAGYAVYALPALPILTLIFGACAYGRKKQR